MKRLHALLLVLATSSTLFIGCGETDAPVNVEVEETTVTTETNESEESDSQTIIDDSAPDEGMVRSKLTNEWIYEENADMRPLAIATPNESAAIPHTGLSDASIIYECNVEGNMTRLLAIYEYEVYSQMDKIGNIRSLRDYYAYWAFEWDAIIAHFGNPYYADDVLAQANTDNLNGNFLNDPFFRSSDRNAPHNAYIDGTAVAEVAAEQNIEMEDRGLADETHFKFTGLTEPNTLDQYSDAEAATYVDMTGCYPLTRAYFEYNEADQLYYRSQHVSGGTDGPHIDGASGEQLTFANLIIQANEYEVRDANGYLWYGTVDNSGRDAWFVTQGKIIKGTWEKDSEFGATRYYDSEGNEIVLNTGKTMVMVIQDGDEFDYK